MNHKQHINIRMSSAISLCLLAALMVAVVPQTLSSLHARMETALCANNLRGCVQAWNVYASEFDGKYMAMWDMSNTWNPVSTQLPFTMWYYTKGISLPRAAYDFSQGGWYNPETLSYGNGFSMLTGSITASMNPQYQCPSIFKLLPNLPKLYNTPFIEEISTYSYCMPTILQNEKWEKSSSRFYPSRDLYTHPATTLLLEDLAKNAYEDTANLWVYMGREAFGIHNGKDNYAFADGHVELLAADAISEDMFKLYYLLDE